MFEVLAFVYENYWGGDSCPELPALHRKLKAVGFDNRQIEDALLWLEELKSATRRLHGLHHAVPSTDLPRHTSLASGQTSLRPHAMRLFTASEQDRLGTPGWGFLSFLVSIGALAPDRLELVMDRTLATPGNPVSMDDLKLIVLMVFWSLGEEPDPLVLDELCDNRTDRWAN